MKRTLLFLSFLILLSMRAHSADFIRGSGAFITKDGDGHALIKKQLIHEAIKNIISQKLVDLKLNKDLFWEKYDQKLNEKITELDLGLRELYKINEETTSKARQKYLQKFRLKKLTLTRSFARIDDMLPKYVVKKMSRSQKNAHYRYIRMEGVVDDALLTKTYYQFIRGERVSNYGTLYLRANYHLEGVTYSELGVDNENDFEGEVTTNWLDWFSKNKPINIANTEVLNKEKEQKLQMYLTVPSESMLMSIPEIFVNSLLLDIEITITKVKFNKSVKEYSFEYKGFGYLKDLQTNLVVKTYRFSKTNKTYRETPNINIANLIANHVYHMAKGSFPRIVGNIKKMTPISSIKRITLTEFKNTGEISDLLKIIERSGVKYSLKTKLESISRGRADVILYFDGEFSEIKAFLTSLQAAKKDLSFDVIESDNALGIKFNRVINQL